MVLILSLSLKISRAFLIVSVTGGLLALVLARWMLVREFEQLVYDRIESEFVSGVTDYYRTNGSWVGVRENADTGNRSPETSQREEAPPPPPSPENNQHEPPPPTPEGEPRKSSGDGEGGNQQNSSSPDYVFLLADADGVVVIPAGNYELGDVVPSQELENGIPIKIDGEIVGTALATGEAPLLEPREERYLTAITRALLLAIPGAAALALIPGLFLARSLTRPLRELTVAVQNMKSGNLEQQVPVRTNDEPGKLAVAFNQMSAELHRVTQQRKQMTADIAHDLRSPLTVIGGYLESMLDGVLEPTQPRLEKVFREVEHLEHLVADLYTLVRSDAGELVLNFQHLPPHTLLTRTANSFQQQATQKHIALQVDGSDNLPAVYVDEERMAQILGNLVNNALHYTPEGGHIKLTARKENDRVIFEVQDTGQGITTEDLPHIFDRFYRAEKSRPTESDNSGLGLAIAKSLVNAHGGTITAHSPIQADGKGSVFMVSLPGR